MSDNITLPREVAELIENLMHHAYNDGVKQLKCRSSQTVEAEEALRTALAAPRPEPEPVAYFDLQKQVFYWAKPTMIDVPMTVALNPLPLYAAPPAAAPEPEPVRHPGYIIGNHWLETAYSRVCAGEAEADVLRDCGWERVTDAEALRRDAECYKRLKSRAEIYDGHVCFGDIRLPVPIPDRSPFDAIDEAVLSDALTKPEDKT